MGVQVYECTGVCKCLGVSNAYVYKYIGVQVYQMYGFTGVQVYKCMGVQYMCVGVQVCGCYLLGLVQLLLTGN